MELAELMTQNVVTLAIRYASRSRRLALAQRLSEIALEKANEVQPEQPEEQEEEADYSSVRQNSGYKSNISTACILPSVRFGVYM